MRNCCIKILVVDDDPSMRLLVSAALESAGRFQVSCASDGQEGFDQACREHPDLVLLDHMLPDGPGSEVIKRLKRDPRTRDQVVVFFTATSRESELAMLRSLGAADVIGKPFAPEELGHRLVRVLGDRSVREAPGAVAPGLIATDELSRNMLSATHQELERLLAMLNDPTSFDRGEARQTVHRWVGRGGAYGYPRVSELARKAEALVDLLPDRGPELRATLLSLQQLLKPAVVATPDPA